MNAFDKNLRRLRIRRNLKQEDLARLLHVTRQTVSGWETGRRQPDLEMLKMLAQVLDADVQELIYGSKPGAYPMYQRKFVSASLALGLFAAGELLLQLLLWPELKALANSHHWGTLILICTILLPQAGAFALGALIPCLTRLWIPVRMKKPFRLSFLWAGLAALLPVILFWLGVPTFRRWGLYSFTDALLRHILPALSGASIGLGAFSEDPDPK